MMDLQDARAPNERKRNILRNILRNVLRNVYYITRRWYRYRYKEGGEIERRKSGGMQRYAVEVLMRCRGGSYLSIGSRQLSASHYQRVVA
jgi:hypothetical protein